MSGASFMVKMISAGLAFAAAAPCLANQFREMSPSGEGPSLRSSGHRSHRSHQRTLRSAIVLGRLKGGGSEPRTFLFHGDIAEDNPQCCIVDGDIAEDNPQCCIVGNVYLIFMKDVGEGYYRSANGPYGVYPTQTAQPW